MRELNVRLGVISRADGSVQYGQGETCLIAAVLGPGDVRAGLALPDRAFVEVTYKPKVGPAKVQDRHYEVTIRSIIESATLTSLYPRTAIHLSLTPLEDRGCLTSASVNAACLALVDSAVAMKHLFAAVTVGYKQEEDLLLVDATMKELKSCSGVITFVFESRNFEVIGSTIEAGSLPQEKFDSCLAVAKEASLKVFQFYRETVQKKFSKELQ